MAIRKYSLRKQKGYTRSHVTALRCGHDYFGVFSTDNEKAMNLMKAVWPELAEAAFISAERFDSGTLPTGYYLFDASCPEFYRRDGKQLKPRREIERAIAAEIRLLGFAPTIDEINSAEYIERNSRYLR